MDKFVGIDLGGSQIRFNDVDAKGNTGQETCCFLVSSTTDDELVEAIVQKTYAIVKRVQNDGDRVLGIGFGSPGPLDYRRGIIETPPNLPKIKNLPIIKILGERVRFSQYPAFLVHDADAALLGEQWLGAARNFRNVAMVTFGTGLGFAVTNDGKLVRGKGRAVEAGHTSIDVGYRRYCSCGRSNCWEAFVSTKGLAATYCEAFSLELSALNQEEIYNVSFKFKQWLAKRDNSRWVLVLSQYCDHVVMGLRNILCNFDPERIVLGGGIMTGNQLLLEAIEKRWQEYMFGKIKDSISVMAGDLEIKLAELPNAGVIGAAKYAMDCLEKDK